MGGPKQEATTQMEWVDRQTTHVGLLPDLWESHRLPLARLHRGRLFVSVAPAHPWISKRVGWLRPAVDSMRDF